MEDVNPFFSIIIPCYNQAQYLEEAVLSVLAQTYQNWECIIINDGSPDATEDIALELTKKDTRLTYLKKKNGGISDARNFGISQAIGKWILCLDADDKIGERYLELAEQVLIANNNVSLIYCNAVFFGSINEDWYLPDISFSEILISNQIFCSALFKKTDWEIVNGFDVNMTFGVEDWEFWINILKDKKEKVIKKIDYLGFYYRIKDVSRDSVFKKDRSKILKMHMYIYEKHKQAYIDNFGSVQDILLSRELLEQKKNNIRVYARNVKHNLITKGLYRLILFFNKF